MSKITEIEYFNTKIRIYSINNFPIKKLYKEIANSTISNSNFILSKSMEMSKFVKNFIKKLNRNDILFFDLIFEDDTTYRYY